MTRDPVEVRVEDVIEAHIAPYAALSRAEYGDAPVSEPLHLRWKFLSNPAGAAKAINLTLGDMLIARLVAQPRAFVDGDRRVRAAYMVDLLVHPQHRGMTTLLQIARALPQLRDSFDVVIVTPNQAGRKVWKDLIKLPVAFDLDVLAIPLRPSRLADHFVPGAAWALRPTDSMVRVAARGVLAIAASRRRVSIDRIWPAIDELDRWWNRVARPPGTLLGMRDADFLDWRFRASPVVSYDVWFVRRAGALTGYLASRRTAYGGYETRFIVDALDDGTLSRRDWLAVLSQIAKEESHRGGADLIMLIGNISHRALAAFSGLPFLAVPSRHLPQPATVFAEWWRARGEALTRDRLALTLADCDMI